MTLDTGIESILERIHQSPYLSTKGCMLQTFRDIHLAQEWSELSVIDLPSISRFAFRGKRPQATSLVVAVPCSLSETLSPEWLSLAFQDLGPEESFYLSISDNESTIVYYRINRGLLKPQL